MLQESFERTSISPSIGCQPYICLLARSSRSRYYVLEDRISQLFRNRSPSALPQRTIRIFIPCSDPVSICLGHPYAKLRFKVDLKVRISLECMLPMEP